MMCHEHRLDRRRLTTALTHVIFILILCVLPEVLLRMSWRQPHAMPWGIYAKSAVMLGVFYLNYFIIIPRTLSQRHRWWRFVAFNLVIIITATVGMYFIAKWGWGPGGRRLRDDSDEWHRMIASASFMLRDAIMLLLTASLAVAIKLSASWRDLERRRESLVALRRESELENLRAQLNPHFLFNTLNSIYALIAISPAEAQTAVHQLSQLLRQVVYDNPGHVSLGSEVEFVRHYISLMKLRLGDRPVQFTVDIGHPDCPVAPLLFMTLVENAFKHGASSASDMPVEITITERDGLISCRTFNHFSQRSDAHVSSGGVGLTNLRRRLELIYGNKAGIHTETAGDTFRAVLTITATCNPSAV